MRLSGKVQRIVVSPQCHRINFLCTEDTALYIFFLKHVRECRALFEHGE